MLNVCYRCGAYRADKQIVSEASVALCPECGYPHSFLQLPLLVVTGASGAGKSTVCRQLLGRVTEAVLLDVDILWGPAFNKAETGYREFFEVWLRLCKNISQSGRPVVLFGAGVGVPANLERCVERRYFAQLHYLALICAEEVLRSRLARRPAWRNSHTAAYLEEHLRFNQWFKAYAEQPPIERLDTTEATVAETAQDVAAWIKAKIEDTQSPESLKR